MHWCRFALVLLACCAVVPTSAGADRGNVRGRVSGPDGTPLAGVTLELKAEDGAPEPRVVVTDAAGRFQIPDVRPGRQYRLEAALAGYATVIVTDVVVTPNHVVLLEIVLTASADLQERIEVRGRPSVIQPDVAPATTVLSAEFIDGMPILGRNYQDILTLAPGVSDVDGDGNPNIHGARDTDVITLVDGVNTTDPLTGKFGMQLNIESIQEIEIKTAAASAEFGRAQGGFANIITRSGGNRFESAFKFFWRSSVLDGDGAGTDDPALHSGVGGESLSDVRFDDFLGFISLSGPFVRDRAWFYATFESIDKEEPVNALSNQFVTGLRERRVFGKVTWQVSPSNRLAFSVHADPQEFLNQGLDSFTSEETGYTQRLGGALATLRLVSILTPEVALETTLAYLEGTPGLDPNLGPDTNGNGALFDDRNADGFLEARERDPGEDFDGDGRFDVHEDPNHDGRYDLGEDIDGDGVITRPWMCEGDLREDIDCDGRLDPVDEDTNHNGALDRELREDIDHDGHLDRGGEDRNGNGILDDAPFPASGYPYGRTAPAAWDREYEMDLVNGTIDGPYWQVMDDVRSRLSLRQDLSVFEPGFHGSHDMRFGYSLEREAFERDVVTHDLIARRDFGAPFCIRRLCINDPRLPPQVVNAILPAQREAHGEATGQAAGIYVQDAYKPVPGLSIGLGLRFDREALFTAGFTEFDPSREAALYNRLRALAGAERGLDDLLAGNADGLQSLGIMADPIAAGTGTVPPSIADLREDLELAAVRRLTGPRTPAEFDSPQIQQLLSRYNQSRLDQAFADQIGLRLQQPEEFAITNNNLAPRLSVAWDPSGDGRTKLFTTWGRYYDKLFLNTVVVEQGPDSIHRYYNHDKWGANTTYEYQSGLFGVEPNHHIGSSISRAPASIRQVDRSLQTPYSDELTMGFEREVAPEVRFALRFVQRDYRDQLQDVDLNHHVRRDPTQGGALLDTLGIVRTLPLGGEIRLPDGRPDLFINNFFFNQVLRVGNYNEARYRGLELEVWKRLSHRWELLGSYTYSRAQGAAEDYQSRLGNDPSVIESEYGYLDFDQRHVVKLNLTTYLPHDWQFSLRSAWSSGLPYSIISRFFALDNADYQQFRTRYGFTSVEEGDLRFNPLPRNSERNDAVLDLNLLVRKNFVIGNCLTAVSLEVFNLLNSDDLTITSIEPNRLQGFDPGGFDQFSTPLEIDGTRRFGRRLQIGFHIAF